MNEKPSTIINKYASRYHQIFYRTFGRSPREVDVLGLLASELLPLARLPYIRSEAGRGSHIVINELAKHLQLDDDGKKLIIEAMIMNDSYGKSFQEIAEWLESNGL